MANGYYWNSRIVFVQRGRMWRFGWVSVCCLLVNVGIVRYAPVVVGSVFVARIVATGVSAVVGYVLNRRWTFG
ncbi:GtrA family protein [Fodinisporobacter ferrooxydans]|uniref:GtrA family protein n=1 Tax=Fodinisporobacter ferrooxydans TaxID=2901836 RepID=A0ABY4CQZ2_9BACL|nr:GtrA family protein [Alicyclobacillaceae bacterium MYW30-H2]